MIIALVNSSSVFSIVVFSWTILGFLLTPLLIMIFLNKTINAKHFIISGILSTMIFYIVNNYVFFEGVYLGIYPFVANLIYLYFFLKRSKN
jgi:hypothetical protein